MTAWITDVVNVMELGRGIGVCGGTWVTTRRITIIACRIIVTLICSSGSGSSWRVATVIITIIALRIGVTSSGTGGRRGSRGRWVATS